MGEPWAAGLANIYPTMAIPIQKGITTKGKSQPVSAKKKEKKKAGEDEFTGFREKRIGTIPSYFLTGFASFTTSRTGYLASHSGTLYMQPVRVSGESVSSKSAGTATAMASPSFP